MVLVLHQVELTDHFFDEDEVMKRNFAFAIGLAVGLFVGIASASTTQSDPYQKFLMKVQKKPSTLQKKSSARIGSRSRRGIIGKSGVKKKNILAKGSTIRTKSMPGKSGSVEVSAQVIPVTQSNAIPPAKNTLKTISTSGSQAKRRLFRLNGLGGVAFTNWDGDSTDGRHPITRFHGGATVDIGRGPFKFETGVIYRQLGVGTTRGFAEPIKDGQITLDYIEIPLAAKFFMTSQGSAVGAYLLAGAAPKILIQKDVLVDVDGELQTLDAEQGTIRNWDIGPVGGLGVTVDTGRGTELFLEASYYRGLLNLDESGNTNVFNSAVSISTGLSIGL